MASKTIYEIFEHFNQATVLVVGDVMLDTYFIGSSDRISPEAPVPVVNIKQKESRLGGAANVAMNLKNLGANAIVVSAIGNDYEGERLKKLFRENELSPAYLLECDNRPTTEKSRVISKNRQMLRIDHETEDDLTAAEETSLFNLLKKAFAENEPDAVIFQDYNKGVLTEKVIRFVLDYCTQHNIPTAVDPKRKNFFAYKGCTLFKPNLKEVNEALHLNMEKQNLQLFEQAAAELKKQLNHQFTLITLSEKGMFVSDHQNSEIVPATVRDVADVSGAGDTVISVATLCMVQQLEMLTLATLANIAGGIACEQVGVSAVDKEVFYKEAAAVLKKVH